MVPHQKKVWTPKGVWTPKSLDSKWGKCWTVSILEINFDSENFRTNIFKKIKKILQKFSPKIRKKILLKFSKIL